MAWLRAMLHARTFPTHTVMSGESVGLNLIAAARAYRSLDRSRPGCARGARSWDRCADRFRPGREKGSWWRAWSTARMAAVAPWPRSDRCQAVRGPAPPPSGGGSSTRPPAIHDRSRRARPWEFLGGPAEDLSSRQAPVSARRCRSRGTARALAGSGQEPSIDVRIHRKNECNRRLAADRRCEPARVPARHSASKPPVHSGLLAESAGGHIDREPEPSQCTTFPGDRGNSPIARFGRGSEDARSESGY